MDIQATLTKMARMIEATLENECDCSAVYEVMDELVEALEQGADVSAMRPEIEHHLAMCPCCQHELDALRLILAAGDDV